MTKPKPRATRQQLGQPLDLSDEDLDRMSEITETDILKTEQAWERAVPAWAKNLLLAESQGG
jgi:hypothetical protein